MLTKADLKISKAFSINKGTEITSEGVIFTSSFNYSDSLLLNIYNTDGSKIIDIDLKPYHLFGNLYSICLLGKGIESILYDYCVDGKIVNDPYERNHQVIRQYGEKATDSNFEKSLLDANTYDWEEDQFPKIKYSDLIGYSLHVRGFTKHPSSKVKGKGTFKGIIEKIPYLKELGINQIELMPSYEFYEFNSDKDSIPEGHPRYASDKLVDDEGNVVANEEKLTLNYWGFKEAHYFCPKASYSYSKNFVKEFKDMVKELHRNGIEVIMQFFFDRKANRNLISEVIRFWHINYHVDGFHIMGENLPKNNLCTDEALVGAKLYFEFVSLDELGSQTSIMSSNVAEINKGFLTDARRFLKSDDGSLYNFMTAQRYNPSDIHRINYLTCYEGFTLADLVMYDYKHNEANNEDNRDGSDYNYSWNCGIEGPTKKKTVSSLRIRQIKNAMSLLLLSEASPMLFMGDELLNSQKGNNNPYCQDNEITWINWKLNKTNSEIYDFVKKLISLRKSYKGLHIDKEFMMMDYRSLGYPDISYHQDMAWKSRTDTFIKHIGMLIYGEYFEEDSVYILYNMHWENHLFGIPKLPNVNKWECIMTTSTEMTIESINEELSDNPETLCVYGRSVMILKSNSVKTLGGKKNVRR